MVKNLSTKLLVSLSIVGSMSIYGQCTPVSEFSENFDALLCCDMGVVPPCWNSIITSSGGNQLISNSAPASAPRNVYQFGYNTFSLVIMPPLTNINAGTHHFKFKARVGSNTSTGLLQFGYMTDANDPSTYVVLQSITIANATYDNTSERTFDVPTTVPANARLAIRNPGTSFAGHYWDDAVWEPKVPLSTVEISRKENLKIYPNPFKDVISISDVQSVEEITVVDVSGRLVKTIINPSSEINLSDLKSGIYFVNIKSKGDKLKTIKAIKE